MGKSLTIDNLPSAALIKAELSAEFGQIDPVNNGSIWGHNRERSLFHASHVLFLKGRCGLSKHWVIGALRESIGERIATFLAAVLHVIGLGALKQMVEANAKSVVTMMQHKKVWVHWAMKLLPIAVTVSAFHLATIDRGRTVARAVEASRPVPARFGLFDLLPKLVSRHLVNVSLRLPIFNYALG